MRKIMVFAAAACLSGAATAQTTTNCNTFGSTIRCTTSPDVGWQNQQNMNQAFSNLGAAIAARRERKRQEKAAEAVAAQYAAGVAAVKTALDADTAIQLPPPADEQPVRLVCTGNGSTGSLALYEKHGRVDVTMDGATKTRSATFSTEAITWVTPLMRSSLSRLDGSFVGYGNIPELAGQSVTGTCALATERKF